MDDNTIITFGKYRGSKLSNIPSSYLLWLYNEGKCYGELKEYIEFIEKEVEIPIKIVSVGPDRKQTITR